MLPLIEASLISGGLRLQGRPIASIHSIAESRSSLKPATLDIFRSCGHRHYRSNMSRVARERLEGWLWLNTGRRQSDAILHPWRFVEDREDAGLPYWDAASIPVGVEGGFMRLEDVQLGMFVRVHRSSRKRALRDRIGIVRHRYGERSHSPFEVQFEVQFENIEDKQLELLWAGEFEEAEEFYQHYG
jgi:hypothetical protein